MILNSALNTEFTFTVGWQHYLMIGIYFLVLIGIGLYAYKHSTSSMDEYTLGGRNIGPLGNCLISWCSRYVRLDAHGSTR